MKNTIKWAKQSLVKHIYIMLYIIVVIQIVMVDDLPVP